MKVRVIILAFVLSLVVSSVYGFDGERKGFVLGGGIGFAPTIKWGVGSDNISESGVAINLIIGHAFDNNNMIVYEGNVAGYTDDMSNLTVTQGINGVSWYHYFGPAGRSGFTTAGIGLYVFGIDSENNKSGGALILGGGYEFARHWQVGAYFTSGKTSLFSVDFDHSNFSILISTVAF